MLGPIPQLTSSFVAGQLDGGTGSEQPQHARPYVPEEQLPTFTRIRQPTAGMRQALAFAQLIQLSELILVYGDQISCFFAKLTVDSRPESSLRFQSR
jgi:hypothetical protein